MIRWMPRVSWCVSRRAAQRGVGGHDSAPPLPITPRQGHPRGRARTCRNVVRHPAVPPGGQAPARGPRRTTNPPNPACCPGLRPHANPHLCEPLLAALSPLLTAAFPPVDSRFPPPLTTDLPHAALHMVSCWCGVRTLVCLDCTHTTNGE